MCSSSNSLIRKRLVIPGRRMSLHSAAISRSGHFPVDPSAKLHQCVLQVDDVIQPGAKQIAFPVSGFFGRIAAAPRESRLPIRENLEDEFASFRCLAPRKPAI
jgi:hypothetical protein